MKKIAVSCCLSLALFCGFTNANKIDDELNKSVRELLLPYQNDMTEAKLNFQNTKLNKQRLQSLSVDGSFLKRGKSSEFGISLDKAQYTYAEDTNAMTTIVGSLTIDLTKLIPQEQINQMLPMAEQFLQIYTAEITKDCGDACTFEGAVTSAKQDDSGNYTNITAIVKSKIDLDKLPTNMSKQDFVFTELNVSVKVDFKKGLSFDAYLVSNKEHGSFAQDNKGLKEYIEGLIHGNRDTLAELNNSVQNLNTQAGEIVDKMDNA